MNNKNNVKNNKLIRKILCISIILIILFTIYCVMSSSNSSYDSNTYSDNESSYVTTTEPTITYEEFERMELFAVNLLNYVSGDYGVYDYSMDYNFMESNYYSIKSSLDELETYKENYEDTTEWTNKYIYLYLCYSTLYEAHNRQFYWYQKYVVDKEMPAYQSNQYLIDITNLYRDSMKQLAAYQSNK